MMCFICGSRVHISSFSGVLPCLWFATCVSVSFCLTVCLYSVLGRSAMSLILALYRRYPLALSGAVLSNQKKQVFQWHPLCGLCVPFCCGWAMSALSTLKGGAGP